MGADVSYEHFERVSGVADIRAAIALLNSRLVARGALLLAVFALRPR